MKIHPTSNPTNKCDERVVSSFSVIAFSAIFLQKFGFSAAGSSIGLDAPILWGELIWLFIVGKAEIDSMRFGLMFMLLLAVAISLLLGPLYYQIISFPSLGIFLMMYAVMVFRVDVSRPTAIACVTIFQSGMTIIAVIVLGQQLLQYTVGNAYWPNLDKLVPRPLLIEGYAYLRPYTWNSPYLTPNGIFFLEPSALSSFLAIALCAEIIYLKRLRRIILFAVALMVGMAGTGPTIVALTSPLLFIKMGRRLRKWTVCIILPSLIIAGAAGAFSHYVSRSAEFSSDNSSAYARMIIPFRSTMGLLDDQDYLLTGKGPGSSPKGNNQVQWPANKLIYEYGLLTTVIFHAFLLFSILGRPFSRAMALIVLIPHLFFGGGFVAHTNIMLLVMFGSLLRLRLDEPQHVLSSCSPFPPLQFSKQHKWHEERLAVTPM